MLDVGEQQFLVLLFVLQAQLQMLQCLLIKVACRQPRLHLCIDLLAVVAHLLQRWPRQQPTLRPGMRRPDALVVAVEQVIPGRVMRRCSSETRQHEAFEEPGGVGQVPFTRAGIGHALQHGILGAERRGQLHAARTHPCELVGEIVLRGSDGGGYAVHVGSIGAGR